MAQFNANKWNYILVASVVGWLLFMSSLYIGSCVFAPVTCPNDGRVIDFINGLLASVFAYVAGRSTSKGD